MAEKKTANSLSRAPVVGIDLGGTKILAASVDARGKILSRFKKKTKAKNSHKEVISRIALCARGAVEQAGLDLSRIAAVGIGAPGALNPEKGVIHLAPNLNWENVPLKKILEQELKRPVFIGNDVNVGILGEHRMGAGKGMQNLVGIFIGTGIGGGLVFNGQIYEGAHFMAGEIGHIPLVKGGPVCGCGRRGCFEAVAGRLAIVRSIENKIKKGKKSILEQDVKGDFSRIKSRRLAWAWKEKDPVAVRELKSAARYIGWGTAIALTLLNPDAVILGGGLIEAMDDKFFEYIVKSAKQRSFSPIFKETKILRALLGDDAGIVGAAFLARDKLVKK